MNRANRKTIRATSCLLVTGIILSSACDKTNTTPSASAMTIQLDGTIGKWSDKKPAWDNGPAPADQPPDKIHIGKVYFDNDGSFLYAFVQCSPSVADRFKETQFSGDIGGIFVDPDNNPDTGSAAEGHSTNPNDRGYKTKIYLALGAVGDKPMAGYQLFRFTGKYLEDNNGFNEEVPHSDQNSFDQNALIAFGKDGVELAIPLDQLGLRAGATARIMIEPSAPDQGTGFTTYKCH